VWHDNTTMLYKFKSQAASDLIMLEPNGRQILQVLKKDGADEQIKGILEPKDMPQALAQLDAAIALEEAQYQALVAEALEKGEAAPPVPAVTLRQRATPFMAMIKRSQQADAPIVWGV
jgi:tRNA nucleotidyltransferase/poly(A) polymerase